MSAFHDNMLLGASGAGGGYQIERSLRFNSADSAYLNRTPASAGNRKTWTWSGWVKRSKLGVYQPLFSALNGTSDTAWLDLGFNSSDELQVSGYSTFWRVTTQVSRDLSAWYHVVVSVDTTQATANDRIKFYVNGTQITAFTTTNNMNQNDDTGVNAASIHYLGRSGGAAYYFDGYLTEIHFIDGQALTPSSFGEINSVTGVWRPKKYAGTYGTNGFYLTFADNSGTTSTTLGKDGSGNGNNWTPNNFSVTAGSGNDSMIDTPTSYADGGNGRGNYATLNPLDANGGSLSNGNLEYAGTYTSVSTQNGHGCRSTLRVRPTGKWYAEAANATYSGIGNSCMLGFTSSIQAVTATAFGGTLTPWIGVDASVVNSSVRLLWNGVSGGTANHTQLFASYASGDVVNFAIDFDAGKFWAGKNGTWYNSGDPATGANATSTFTVGSSDWAFWGEYIASDNNYNRSSVVANFGQRPFAYTPPAGFLALNTQNLPEPTIKKPGSYFDTVLFSGTSASTVTVTGLNFQPDLVWAKPRTGAWDHYLWDSVRGATKYLNSNLTASETTDANSLTSFNSNGFSAGAGANFGPFSAGNTEVAWCWDESATPGFDIVTYTGTGVARTVAHSLGVAPSMMIVKNRSAVSGWIVYHKFANASPATGGLRLNLADGFVTYSPYWNNTEPTSSVFTVGTENQVNGNTDQMVAYLWSEVAGFSKFGSYTGNGSSDGPFVFCGFRPRWILMKSSTSAATPWQIFDSARETFNTIEQTLIANASYAEPYDTASPVDFLSNGFKLRGGGASYNNYNTGTWIFAAFAETPMKYGLAF